MRIFVIYAANILLFVWFIFTNEQDSPRQECGCKLQQLYANKTDSSMEISTALLSFLLLSWALFAEQVASSPLIYFSCSEAPWCFDMTKYLHDRDSVAQA